jgi:hypothetical protein
MLAKNYAKTHFDDKALIRAHRRVICVSAMLHSLELPVSQENLFLGEDLRSIQEMSFNLSVAILCTLDDSVKFVEHSQRQAVTELKSHRERAASP